MSKKVNLKNGLSFAWDTFKKNFIYFAGAMIIYWGLFILKMTTFEELQARLMWGENVGGQVLLLLIAGLLQFLVLISIIKVGLFYLNNKDSAENNDDLDDEKEVKTVVIGLDVNIKDLFDSPKVLGMIYLHYLIATILFTLIVFQGLMLLVIPGIYFAIKCIFYMFYIIDEQEDAIQALEDSYYGTNKKEFSIVFAIFTLSAITMTTFLVAAILFALLPEALAAILFLLGFSIVFIIKLLSLSWIYKNDIATKK